MLIFEKAKDSKERVNKSFSRSCGDNFFVSTKLKEDLKVITSWQMITSNSFLFLNKLVLLYSILKYMCWFQRGRKRKRGIETQWWERVINQLPPACPHCRLSLQPGHMLDNLTITSWFIGQWSTTEPCQLGEAILDNRALGDF